MQEHRQVKELTDPKTIRQYLNSDRLYAAYALGDLEPSLFAQCRWWLAERDAPEMDQEWALVLEFAGLTPHAVLSFGDPVGVRLILAQAPLPETLYLICRQEHMQPAREVLDLPAPRHMIRMVLQPKQFCPAPSDQATRLTMDWLDDLQALYALDPGAAGAFAPYQLANGVFFGVELDGRLVSAAGTHLVAPTERIGAIGSVFTHPAHRGRGYAAACTSAVSHELLAQELTTVLNVGTQNSPAIRLYQRLGFEAYCTYYETVGTKTVKEKLDD